jgi:hypothetical protein
LLEVSLSLHFVIRRCNRFQRHQAMLPLGTYWSTADKRPAPAGTPVAKAQKGHRENRAPQLAIL